MSKEELMERLFKLEKQVELLTNRIKALEQRSIPFKAPLLDEVLVYFTLKGSGAEEAEKYHNYYQSKDWKVGKSKMKDWKAAARNWIRNNQNTKKSTIFDL